MEPNTLGSARWLLTGALIAPLLVAPAPCLGQATVVFDGSLGEKGPAPTSPLPSGGVEYRIDAERGRLVESSSHANLFHSFDDFSVQRNDAAVFAGPGAVDNIFARVTGGDVSRIDGLLRSEIGSADLYLLNPSGVILGPESRIEVDGAFHASTTETLTFGTGELFEIRRDGATPLLAVSAPTEFGFLGGPEARILIDGKDAAPGVAPSFEVDGLSLRAGSIDFENGGGFFLAEGSLELEAAHDIRFSGSDRVGAASGIGAPSGAVKMTATRVELLDGPQVGAGAALTIQASRSVEIAGQSERAGSSGLGGSSIFITAPSIQVGDGASPDPTFFRHRVDSD